jgi:hypothetical protein
MFVSPVENQTIETAPAPPSPPRSAALAEALVRRPYLLLLAALPLLPFANGTMSVPLAAWLAPALLLCFVRTRPGGRGLALGFVAFYAAWCVQWRGVVRLPWAAFLITGAVIALVGFLPYVADRLLANRLRGLKATLVFPTALVTMEYLFNVRARLRTEARRLLRRVLRRAGRRGLAPLREQVGDVHARGRSRVGVSEDAPGARLRGEVHGARRRSGARIAAPEGRLAAAICYDGDFPGFMRQTAPADLLILHADDWRDITPLHARMSVFRAIELGVSLVRPTMNGLSLAADYRGEILAALNHFNSADRVMNASVPVRGVSTLYALVGDAFAWLAALCLLILTALALLRLQRPGLL